MQENKENSTELILPNLFIPGAAKSATSSLHDYLNQHPDIYMSAVKEPHFFSHDSKYMRGLSEYSKLFQAGKDFNIRGESSTGYMVFQYVVERIKKNIPNPKFIFILRNPIDRAYSHYWWLRGIGFEGRDFREAFLSDMHENPDPSNRMIGHYKYYFQYGCYAKQIARFIDIFGNNSIFIITTEKLRESPLLCLNSCCSFLGISPFQSIAETASNETIILKNPRYYKNIVDIIANRNFLALPKNILRTLISERIRSYIFHGKRMVLDKFKQINNSGLKCPKISDGDRFCLFNFYKNEVERLKNLIGYRFEEWNDFREK